MSELNMAENQSLSRIAKVETRVEAIANSVDALTRTINQNNTHIMDSISRLSEKQADSQKAPWATLAAWAGVILTIVVLLFSGFAWHLTKLEDNMVNHINQDGHSASLRLHERWSERIMVNKVRMEKLDTRLTSFGNK